MSYRALLLRCLDHGRNHHDVDAAMLWFARADRLARMMPRNQENT